MRQNCAATQFYTRHHPNSCFAPMMTFIQVSLDTWLRALLVSRLAEVPSLAAHEGNQRSGRGGAARRA